MDLTVAWFSFVSFDRIKQRKMKILLPVTSGVLNM